MTKKIYHIILLCGLSTILIYSILAIFIFHDQLPRQWTGWTKNILVLFILFYETFNLPDRLKKINLALLVVATLAFLSAIVHWPFSLIVFVSSLTLILAVLFISAFKKQSDRLFYFLICIYLLFHLLHLVTKVFHYPGAAIWSIFELFISIPVISSLIGGLARRKLNAPHNL